MEIWWWKVDHHIALYTYAIVLVWIISHNTHIYKYKPNLIILVKSFGKIHFRKIFCHFIAVLVYIALSVENNGWNLDISIMKICGNLIFVLVFNEMHVKIILKNVSLFLEHEWLKK